jgi:hypothetical protein
MIGLRRVLVPVLASVCLSVVACAAPEEEPEDVASQEGEQRVRPQGVDARNARLVFDTPRSVTPAFFGIYGASGSTKTTDALDVLVGSGPVQKDVWLEGSVRGVDSNAMLALELRPGAITTVKLAGLKVKRAGMVPTLGLETGEKVESTTGIAVTREADGSEAVAVEANAAHQIEWGLLDGQAFTTAREGSISTVRLDAVGPRMRVKIVAPTRELPEACDDRANPPGTITVANGGGRMRGVLESELVVGFNPVIAKYHRAPETPNATYRLPCTGWDMPLQLSASGASPRVLRLGRIDVDDVEVTLPSGGTELRRGTYRIIARGGAVLGTRDFPTNTGIDVPPGSYDVDVTHTSNAGERVTTRYSVTTP